MTYLNHAVWCMTCLNHLVYDMLTLCYAQFSPHPFGAEGWVISSGSRCIPFLLDPTMCNYACVNSSLTSAMLTIIMEAKLPAFSVVITMTTYFNNVKKPSGSLQSPFDLGLL